MKSEEIKLGIYPGSFDPWHKGHEDIVNKALGVFDMVMITKMFNPDKNFDPEQAKASFEELVVYINNNVPEHFKERVFVQAESRSLKEVTEDRVYIHGAKIEISGVIRGLRNGHDLQYEMNNQYWNEDLGIEIPFVYFITDRSLSHISSSAIRTIKKLGFEY